MPGAEVGTESRVRHAVRPGALLSPCGCRMSELEDPHPAGLQQKLKSLKSQQTKKLSK